MTRTSVLGSKAIPEFLAWGAVETGRRVTARDVSAREVIDAAIARVEAVDVRLNAMVVRRFAEARREADAVDAALTRGENPGPLSGVALSIKECFYFPGTPSTIGVERYVGPLHQEEYVPVARLRAAGAVVIGKTNLPQLMVMHEADNPVYGRTNNPWNLDRGPGGSSGGEAAVIAAGGTALGVGNDLGGSIRVPAHFCGIAGIKPTTGRVTNVGGFPNFRGMEAFQPQSGPLARRVEDLTLALRLMCQGDLPFADPQTVPMPWDDPAAVDVGRLRIGWFDDDRFFAAAPAVRRAVRESVEVLRSTGAELIPFAPPEVPEAMRLYFGLVSADGGADCRRILGRSRRDYRVRQLLWLGTLPGALRPAAAALLRALGQPRLAQLIGWTRALSANDYWQLVWELRGFVQRFMAAWREARLDALVCPPHALPALRHGTAVDLGMAASYAMLFNVLGVPAGVVPVTSVRPREETDRRASSDRIDRLAADCERESAGLPIGVQVVAPHWREDVTLAVMGTIESGVKTNPDWPGGRTAELPRGGIG